jgi:hypothetical protein
VTGWVTVARVDGTVEADLVKMRLEAAGVHSLVRDEYVVRMDPVLSNVLGGVRIDVPADQAKAAREVLGDMAIHDTPPPAEAKHPSPCPWCGSVDVRPVARGRLRRLVAALLTLVSAGGGVPRSVATGVRCAGCGHDLSDPAGTA